MNVNDSPLVSICCLTFNHASYVIQALDGFVMQKTSFDYEIIIHDDASTDGTQNIIEAYQKKYPDIIKPILQTENQYSKGIKPIFKYVFPETKGKYIALCEGDDYWTDPLKLQKQVDFLEENGEYAICAHVTKQLNEIHNSRLVFPAISEDKIYTVEDFIAANHVATCSLVFENSAYEYENWLAKSPFGDWPLILICMLNSNHRLMVIKDEMSVYRVHAGGIHGNLHQNNEKLAKAYEQHLNFISLAQKFLFKGEFLSEITRKKMKTVKKISALLTYRHSCVRKMKFKVLSKYYTSKLNRLK